MRKVWEALENNGARVVSDWGLEEAQQAKLDAKLGLLQAAEVDEKTGKVNLPQNLLAGPHYKQKWIYKLKVRGNVMLRPLACLGPVDRQREWTVLARATERDRKLVPADAATTAAARRETIIAHPTNRRLYLDVPHAPTRTNL